MKIKKDNLILILLAVFLLRAPVGYAQIQKPETPSVASDFNRRVNATMRWFKEYIQNAKSIMRNLKTQHEQMKEKADQSKRAVQDQMRKLKNDQAEIKRQQQDARDKAREMQTQQRLQMQTMQGIPGR